MSRRFTFAISIEDLERMVIQSLALQAARAKYVESLEPNHWRIREEFELEIIAGLPARGRAARIARKTKLPVRTVTRHVAAFNKI